MSQTVLERENTDELRTLRTRLEALLGEGDEVKEESADKAGPTGPAPLRQRRLLSRATALAVAAALIAVAGIAFMQTRRAGEQARRADGLSVAASTRQDAQTVAGEFATALLSYDFGNLDAVRQRVLDLSTDTFDSTYTEAFSQGLGPVITNLQASATATVRDIYTTEAAGDTAKAIVVLDSEVTSTAGQRQTVGSYLQIELVRQDGTWLVDKVTPIAAFGDTLTPAPSQPAPTGDQPAAPEGG